jgi:hypothetical protein
MKTVLRLLEKVGGYRRELYLRVENPPYQPLVIEAIPESGPLGLRCLSVAHYGEQNGDLMRDPEMCFELSNPLHLGFSLVSYYWRNDYVGIEQYSRSIQGDHYLFDSRLNAEHENFAALWDRNLRSQGFVEAFDRKRTQR